MVWRCVHVHVLVQYVIHAIELYKRMITHSTRMGGGGSPPHEYRVMALRFSHPSSRTKLRNI